MYVSGVSNQLTDLLKSNVSGDILSIHEHVINCVLNNQIVNITDETIPWNPLSIRINGIVDFYTWDVCGNKPKEIIIRDSKVYIGRKVLRVDEDIYIYNCSILEKPLLNGQELCECLYKELTSIHKPGMAQAIFGPNDRDLVTVSLRKSYQLLQKSFSRREDVGIKNAVEGLIGTGYGLTPSGDDYLCGILYAMRLLSFDDYFKNMYIHISELISNQLNMTTMMSAAFLQQAINGNAGEMIHIMFDGISDAEYETAINSLIKVGHSSGVDMMCGIWTVMCEIGGVG